MPKSTCLRLYLYAQLNMAATPTYYKWEIRQQQVQDDDNE